MLLSISFLSFFGNVHAPFVSNEIAMVRYCASIVVIALIKFERVPCYGMILELLKTWCFVSIKFVHRICLRYLHVNLIFSGSEKYLVSIVWKYNLNWSTSYEFSKFKEMKRKMVSDSDLNAGMMASAGNRVNTSICLKW